jgi:peroxiredoxin
MSQTFSTMLPLGTPAPYFSLVDVVKGNALTLHSFSDKKALLIIFTCRHCPYAKHVKEEISRIGRDYQSKNLGIIAISANDATVYKEDSPEKLKEMAEELKLTFPLCYDETQQTAKAFTAACTPDTFLFNQERKLVYRGQIDDSRPGNGIPVTGKDIRTALDAVLADSEIPTNQKPSIGCNIKWKPGNEPSYFIKP